MSNENMDARRFSALIDGFYASSANQERWPEAAARLANFFGSESTAIQVRTGGFNNFVLRATTANYDQAAQQAYAAHFRELDLWANGWQAIGASGIYAGSELVDPDTLRKSEFCNDYCRRVGIFHFLGAGVKLDSTTVLLLGIHRPIEREDFAAEHRRDLELVLPHLSRAAQMHSLLATANQQRRVACEVFEALSISVIVVDRDCKVVFANHAAEQLLRAGDGLLVRQARVTTRDPRQESALHQCLCRASLLTVGSVVPPADALLVRRAGKQPLSVFMMPFRNDSWLDSLAGPTTIIFVSDPEVKSPPSAVAMAVLYKLTPAETRLLDALLRGERIAEFSERAGISTNTVNTQLKQIFAKTETHRQSDLMRLAYADPIASLIRANRVEDR